MSGLIDLTIRTKNYNVIGCVIRLWSVLLLPIESAVRPNQTSVRPGSSELAALIKNKNQVSVCFTPKQ